MDYEFDNIAHRWFEELKTPFINYLHANFTSLSYDDILDIYSEAWLAMRETIVAGRAKGAKWKAFLFKTGKNMAINRLERTPASVSISRGGNVDDDADGDARFYRTFHEAERARQKAEAKSVYEDPELCALLAAELSYIPSPCDNILKLYYYDGFSMSEIAQAMNYSGPRSAITTKQRCFEKLKSRVAAAAQRLGFFA